jgi:NAD(P)-dependent dehydrogenase (short-subunit alcohol dehydrogenase family)
MVLDGKTVIVTGASSGIGEQAALLLAAEGANLVLGARRPGPLAAVAERIAGAGGKARILAGDVRQEEYAAALVALARAAFGGLDGAFNNAGALGALGPVPEMTAENWRDVVEANLTSGFYAAKHQIPTLRERGGGSIVFTSSFVGHTVGIAGMAAYAAAKAGLIGMVQVLAAEHGPEGIRVNALLPSGTRTGMSGDDPAFHAWVAGLHALKRMADPREIAQAAIFLLSERASFLTGSAMLADGGNSIAKN